jgi:hypothetical protein
LRLGAVQGKQGTDREGKAMKRVVMVVALVLVAGTAAAQTLLENPRDVTFDHADYMTAGHYDGGYFALLVKADNTCDLTTPAASTPTAIDNLGKPTTTTGLAMGASLVARPIGCYVYKVRVLDISGLYSAWSLPSAPFVRRPAPPGIPAVK